LLTGGSLVMLLLSNGLRGRNLPKAHLESLRAAVFRVPPQSITSCKTVSAEVALVVSRLEMDL
jgi:hypothetical protein